MSFLSNSPRSFAKAALTAALLAVFTLAATTRTASAQSSTAGAIGGTVTDSSGALLPGTVVTVTSVDTGAVKTAKANANGEFHVDDLVPGAYTVSFTADGFETTVEKAVTVTVGSLSSVTPKLKPGAISDKIEVTDENPLLHTQDNAISTTIDQTQIDNLPINGRRWSDFARLTPGVVSNSQGFGLLSFRGISFLLNNNTVDGADDNQAYYSEARGRTRTAYSIPPTAVQEFQVNTSNYSAQYGRAAGGVINTVTKSGSNTYHGELFFLDRDNALGGAVNPYTLLSVPNGAGTYNSVPTKPKDWRKQWGGTIGGPILKDKLFWIYTFDQSRRNFPAISRPTDPNDVLAPSNATLPSTETCTTSAFTTTALTYSAEGDYNACEIAALYGVSFQAGSAYYQQGLGIVASFIGYLPRTQDQVINLPKLDWQINDRNRLSLMYNRMRYSSPNGLYSQSTVTEGRSGFGNDNVKEDFGIARLSSVLTNSLVNDALVQYGRDFEYDYQDAPQPNEVPLSQNAFGAAAGNQIGYFLSGGFYAGSNPDLTRFADPDERRLQLLDGLTWSKGKHTAKFGLEYNKVSDYDNNLYNGNGSYSYDWSYTFIADYLNATTGAGGGLGGPTVTLPATGTTPPASCFGAGHCYNQQYYTFSQAFGNPAALIATREYAGYATDDWRVTKNLTLTLGVRYEYEYVPGNPAVNNGNPGIVTATGLSLAATALPQTANRPDDRNNIGPRVGFSWNVYGDGKTVLRGGYGMYYGRIINSNILQTYIDSGSPNGQISFTNLHPAQYTSSTSGATAGCGPTWPNLETSESAIYNCYSRYGGFNASTVAYFDKHIQNPEVHEADLAIEQNLGHNTTFGITYMMSLGRELPTAVDQNLALGATVTAPYAVSTPNITPQTSYCISTYKECAYSLNPGTTNYPLATVTSGGYTTLPHGGKKPPVYPNGYQGKFFINGGTRTNSAYYQLLDVKSAVNSSYHALAFQLDHRYQHGLSLLTNFTWSHGLDDNPYESTVVPGETSLDPTNLRSDYGSSATDVRMRYVGAVVYQPQTHFHNIIMKEVLGDWRIAPLVQAQTGLPYSATVTTSALYNVGAYALTGSGVNGSGSSGASRVPWQHRNSYNYPKTAVFDLRLGKNFYINNKIPSFERVRLELFAEVFNVMNHQNITGVTTEAYTLTDGTGNVPTLTPYAAFGQYTNANSNYTYSPRQVQIAARLHF
jgi:outer membrane receptor protein involved in Fe transport